MGSQRVGHDTLNNNKDDIILNKCITKVTVQIARKHKKMLNLLSNQEHAHLKPQWNAATSSPERLQYKRFTTPMIGKVTEQLENS